MNRRLVWRRVLLCVLISGPIVACAEEVKLQHRGLTLNADLSIADGKRIGDGVILMTHGGLAHRDMEIMTAMRTLFHDNGYNTLAINLSLGVNNRHGMQDCARVQRHTNDDAAEEIRTWVDWLKVQGANRVILLGHSRGGAQTALAAQPPVDSIVKGVVLLAPATRDNTSAADYQGRYGKPLAPLVKQAEEMMKAGNEDGELEHVGLLTCVDTSATAASFLSYYDPSSATKVDAVGLLEHLRLPVLVVIAGADEVVPGLEQKLQSDPALPDNIKTVVIDGSGHFFRDLNAEDAFDAINDFVTQNIPGTK